MAQLQYMPGDPRLVDQLVYELKSKGIFDQFRKECIADVDTRPAYQNLRQRVESSVTTFLTRQTWKADLNKNQLREKLRKHILDGNYLEQGVERIVDQVVNPKVTSVFIPQVEDLVYNYLGIPRKKTPKADAAENTDLLPTDLEAVSPGSVKSNDEDDKENNVQDMDIDSGDKLETTEDMSIDTQKDEQVEMSSDCASMDKSSIPLPTEEIKLENIPAPEHSPKAAKVEMENLELPNESTDPVKVELNNIELPKTPNLSMDIPLPEEIQIPREKDNTYFKPIALQSEDSNSSSSSSIRRNMSPITPVRNFDDDSCDAQQAFENSSSDHNHKELSSFRFNIENKVANNSPDVKAEKKETDLSYQFSNQVNINTYNIPMYDDSSNSHNLQIDYESDANTNTSKNTEAKQEVETSEDIKKDKKDEKKSSNKSSHRSRDSNQHSSSKDKHSNSRDSSRHDKKTSSKDDKSKSNKEREKSKDRGDKKDSSKHRTSHKSSSSSKDKYRSSSSSHRHSSKSSDDKKSSKDLSRDKPSDNNKERSLEKDKDRKESSSRDRKDSKSYHIYHRDSHREKDKKSSKKDKKKDKKDVDDHYSSSGRGNHSRRSTDRDSNDGSSSSKGSQNQNNSKSTTDTKKESKPSSKSENTSTSTSESTSPSDKGQILSNAMQSKPVIRVDRNLETPIANPPRLPFVPDVTLRKPKFANNFEEAKRMMKMRKFLAEEQKRMNQEAALLLEFQANVRPSLSQVYSSIPGPELEFACVRHTSNTEPETTIKEDIKPEEEKKEKVKLEEVKTEEAKMEVKMKEVKKEYEVKFSLENEAEFEVKHVTKDIINDIIGVPSDEVSIENEVADLNVSKNNDSKEEQLSPEEDYEHLKAIDTSIDPLEESIAEIVNQNMSAEVEITVAETLSEADVSEILEMKDETKFPQELQYFAEHEKFSAELEKHKFGNFLKEYIEKNNVRSKMYLMNCDTYEENIFKEMAAKFGDYEIVNYHKNGHLVPSKNILNESSEISLPLESNEFEEKSPIFSPVKSECSFELSSDYDAKLNEIVNKKSRQEVMEIILGGMIDESTTKMPTIDYYTEISDSENNLTIVEEVEPVEEVTNSSLKRRMSEEVNESRSVLTPNKIRKISDSEQISSTTEEIEEISNNNKTQAGPRSKYLGRAKRVGLSRPKRCALPNSPSSDKSVENYAQNAPTPNGKLKAPRSKVQRYDTSDLYKPKLHYLSRRNNIS